MTSSIQKKSKKLPSFHTHFSDLKDPRRSSKGNFSYSLDEILFLVIAAVISGASEWTTIAMFGEAKLNWLRTFLPYSEGTPSHDVLGKLFARLDIDNFNSCFINWVNELSQLSLGEVVAIDGKTIRGSVDKQIGKSAFHVVSAYASSSHLCLGQKVVDEKSNEITAIPKLLGLLDIEGTVVTIDAMGCQHKIAKKIIEKKADYLLMVKDNQKTLKQQIENSFSSLEVGQTDQWFDMGHDRIEKRTCEVINDLQCISKAPQWEKLKTIVKITSERTQKSSGKASAFTRYYISSLQDTAHSINRKVRSHWAIENNLHWMLDVILKEDQALKKKDNSAAIFNMINKIALSLLKKETSKKLSSNAKRIKAALDDNYRQKILLS